MGGKDRAGGAALRALLGSNPPNGKLPEKGSAEAAAYRAAAEEKNRQDHSSETGGERVRPPLPLPEKGSAEAAVYKAAEEEKAKQAQEPKEARRLPTKGSAEAEVHRLAEEEKARRGQGAGVNGHGGVNASGSQGSSMAGNLGFLALVIGLPLAIVGGLYYNAAIHHDEASANLARENADAAKVVKDNTGSGSAARSTAKSPTRLSTKSPAMAGEEPRAESETGIAAKPAATSGSEKAKAGGAPADKKLEHVVSDAAAISSSAAASSATSAGADHQAAAGSAASPAKTHEMSGAAPHWGYDDVNWGKIDPSFRLCASGASQSPVDIPLASVGRGPELKYEYRASGGNIVNNGHSIQINLDNGGRLVVNGSPYRLIQFHFHTPSENHINGRSFPLEIHMVHKDEAGQLVVVAIMVEGEGDNMALSNLHLPSRLGERHALAAKAVNPLALLPENRTFLTFSGSLTTPPCSENVGWVAFREPIRIPAAVIDAIHNIVGKNNRPIQPLNGRAIYEGG